MSMDCAGLNKMFRSCVTATCSNVRQWLVECRLPQTVLGLPLWRSFIIYPWRINRTMPIVATDGTQIQRQIVAPTQFKMKLFTTKKSVHILQLNIIMSYNASNTNWEQLQYKYTVQYMYRILFRSRMCEGNYCFNQLQSAPASSTVPCNLIWLKACSLLSLLYYCTIGIVVSWFCKWLSLLHSSLHAL